MRIIALAHRSLTDAESARLRDARNPLTRDEMERGLTFDGFLAFACPVRNDTPDVIKALRASSHTVMMATGDSALTALHVANEVHIAEGGLERAMMLVKDEDDGLEWVSAKTDENTGEPTHRQPYKSDGSIPDLAKKYSLCVTGGSLNAAAAIDGVSLGKESLMKDNKRTGRGGGGGGLWDYLDSVVIFARMSPDDKERVLKRLKQQGRHTFMCGDGANDVGALKQAHVGVALLSGFGGANTKKVTPAGEEDKKYGKDNNAVTVPTDAKAETFAQKMERVKEQAAKVKEARAREAAARKADQKELVQLQKAWFEEELTLRTAAGEQWAQFSAMKAATGRMITETKRRQAERARANGGGGVPGFSQMMQEMEGAEDMETPQVKLGDASMAAPFTSRVPSVRSAVDIIRQGRCTLVSAIQMQQVLVLSCLISAYSLSVLYLDGIRSSDNQMIASGSALTAASLAFSYATPVHTLSHVPSGIGAGELGLAAALSEREEEDGVRTARGVVHRRRCHALVQLSGTQQRQRIRRCLQLDMRRTLEDRAALCGLRTLSILAKLAQHHCAASSDRCRALLSAAPAHVDRAYATRRIAPASDFEGGAAHGAVPVGLACSDNHVHLDFADNALIGTLPECYTRGGAGDGKVSVARNMLSGQLPAVGPTLRVLDVSDNRLEGNLDAALGAATGLRRVATRGNKNLKGTLRGLAKAAPAGLEYLDVSECGLDDTGVPAGEGVAALAAASPKLKMYSLLGNNLGSAGAAPGAAPLGVRLALPVLRPLEHYCSRACNGFLSDGCRASCVDAERRSHLERAVETALGRLAAAAGEGQHDARWVATVESMRPFASTAAAST